MSDILIIEDEPSVGWAYAKAVRTMGHQADVVPSAEEALSRLAKARSSNARRFDLALLDVHLPGMNGLEALSRLTAEEPAMPVIVLTAYSTPETTVEATRRGALDYLLKGDFNLDDLKRAVRAGLETAARRAAATVAGSANPAGSPNSAKIGTPGRDLGEPNLAGVLVGNCPAMQEVYKRIGLAAASELPVLVEGETGTGKELVGHSIHRHSPRSHGPYVVVNCACLPGELLESELFGHVKGAFTGAASDKPGQVELADGGTLFLDELGELPISMQASLLRFTETRQASRVGGRSQYRVNVRLVAATNKNLLAEVESGRFRRDLYYRLNALPIRLPPLRERGGDRELLLEHFLRRSARAANSVAGITPSLSEPARQRLLSHSWPGNVREMRNAIDSAVLLARGGLILPEHLPPTISGTAGTTSAGDADGGAVSAQLARVVEQIWAVRSRLAANGQPSAIHHDSLLELLERPLLTAAFRQYGGNQARMAAALDLHRTTLREKLRRYGLIDPASASQIVVSSSDSKPVDTQDQSAV